MKNTMENLVAEIRDLKQKAEQVADMLRNEPEGRYRSRLESSLSFYRQRITNLRRALRNLGAL